MNLTVFPHWQVAERWSCDFPFSLMRESFCPLPDFGFSKKPHLEALSFFCDSHVATVDVGN